MKQTSDNKLPRLIDNKYKILCMYNSILIKDSTFDFSISLLNIH